MLNSRPKPVSPASSSATRTLSPPTAAGLTVALLCPSLCGLPASQLSSSSAPLATVAPRCFTTHSHHLRATDICELTWESCTGTDSRSRQTQEAAAGRWVWQAARAGAALEGPCAPVAVAWPQGLTLSTCYCEGDVDTEALFPNSHTHRRREAVRSPAVQLRGDPGLGRAAPHGAAPGRPRAFDK